MDNASNLLSDSEPDEALSAINSDDFRSFVALSATRVNRSQHGEGC